MIWNLLKLQQEKLNITNKKTAYNNGNRCTTP